MTEMEPEKFLEHGACLLAEKLRPLGYEFAMIQPPLKGSGGPFAWGAFRRGDREIKLWARYDRLGSVHYRLGDDEFTHQDYMRALGWRRRRTGPASMTVTRWAASRDSFEN
jgi:hypothetical protein